MTPTTRRPCLLLGLAALPLAAAAQELPPKPTMQLEVPPIDATAQVGMFPSGLQVMASLDESTTEVVATFVIDAGWSKEPADARGVSLLFERLWWRSEVAPGVRVLDQLVTSYGCEVDSLVGPDVLRFTSTCPRSTIDAAMRVWSRLFTEPLAGITDAAIAEEALAFRTDAAVRARLADNQLTLLAPPLYGQLFPPGHPYHVPADLNLAAIPLAKVKDWAFKTVLPAHTTAAVMGGYSADHWMHGPALVAGNLEPRLIDPRLTPAMVPRWPLGDAEEIDPADPSSSWGWPEQPGSENEGMDFGQGRPGMARLKAAPGATAPTSAPFLRLTGPYDRPLVVVGWSVPGSWREDEILHTVAANTVQAIVGLHLDEPSIERFLGCAYLPGLEGGLIACTAQIKPGQQSGGERIGNRIVDQLTYIGDVNNRTEVETSVGMAQQGALMQGITQLDALGGVVNSRSYWLSSGTHLVGDPLYWSKRLGGVSSIKADDIIDFVSAHITRTRGRILQIDPPTGPSSAPTLRTPDPTALDDVAGLPTYWELLASSPGAPPMPADRATAARIDRDATEVDLSKAQVRKLPNGLEVILLPLGTSPTAHVRLVGRMGSVDDPTPHHAYTFARAMMTAHREPADGIAGTWYSWLDETHQVFGIRGSTSNLSQLLYLLRDAADGMNATLKTRITWTADTRRAMVDDRYDPMWHVDAARRAHLFPTSLIGQHVTAEDFLSWAELDVNLSRDMMRSQWRPVNASLVVVGGFEDVDGAWERIEDWWGGWNVAPPEIPYSPDPLAPDDEPTRPAVAVFAADRPDAADLVVSCRVEGGREDALAAAAWLRQGLPTALDAAWVDAESWSPRSHLVTVRARVSPTGAGPAARALLDRAQAAAKATPDDARQAAWQAALELGEPLTSERDAAAFVTDLLGQGLTLADHNGAGARLAAMTPASLGQALGRCAEGAWIGVVGDAGALSASLSAAGLSPTTVDWLAKAKADHALLDPKGFEKAQKTK